MTQTRTVERRATFAFHHSCHLLFNSGLKTYFISIFLFCFTSLRSDCFWLSGCLHITPIVCAFWAVSHLTSTL